MCKKERKKKKIWIKQVYLQRPVLSHARLMEVLDADDLRNFLRMTPQEVVRGEKSCSI